MLPFGAYGGVPKALHIIPVTCGGHMVEIWVYVCAYPLTLLGCSPFPLLVVGVQGMKGQQSCVFPLNCIAFCQIRKCRKETRKMET